MNKLCTGTLVYEKKTSYFPTNLVTYVDISIQENAFKNVSKMAAFFPSYLSSLWLNNWWYLTTPSHCLNQYWLIISGVLWHSFERNFHNMILKITFFKSMSYFPGANELMFIPGVECGRPPFVLQGQYNALEDTPVPLSTIQLECDEGYVASTEDTLVCRRSGWTGTRGRCTSAYWYHNDVTWASWRLKSQETSSIVR